MPLTKLDNPFTGGQQTDDTATFPPGNIPDLHADVLGTVTGLLAQTRQAGKGVGLLVIGQTGAGKSHMIAQLRERHAADPKVVVAAVRMAGAFAGRLWTHVRGQLVGELLRPYPTPDAGPNGLLRLLRNRFPKWAAGVPGASNGLLDWLLGKSAGKNDLSPFLEEFNLSHPIGGAFRRVLPRVGQAGLSGLAHDWLRGEPLGDDDLQRLGLPAAAATEQQREVDSRQVVLALLALAGAPTTLLVCFDQIEAIQGGTFDSAALRQFTTVVTEMVVAPEPRVIATFMRSGLHADISRAAAESDLQSNLDKMGRLSVTIPTLNRDQCDRLIVARLRAAAACQAERDLRPTDRFWPLTEEFVGATFQKHRRSLTPRTLILACAVGYDALFGKPEAVPPGDDILRMWQRHRVRWLEKLQGVRVESLMGIVVPWLVEVHDAPFVRMHDTDPDLGDVDMVFQPAGHGRRPAGITACNQEPKVLIWRLKRLLRQWEGARGRTLGSLTVLRFIEPRPTAAAAEAIGRLRVAGVRVLELARTELADLAAIQAMFTASLSGELTRAAEPVEAGEFTAWAKGHLPDPVKEFFRLVFEPAKPPAGPPLTQPAAVPRPAPPPTPVVSVSRPVPPPRPATDRVVPVAQKSSQPVK